MFDDLQVIKSVNEEEKSNDENEEIDESDDSFVL